MKKSLIFAFLYVLSITCSLAESLQTDNRWGVCFLTLNSSDEKKIFKKRLSSERFNFIELMDFNPKGNKYGKDGFEPEAWFDNACTSKKINRCDMIIISGHFTPYARTFYGEEHDYTLSLENLLKHRCSKSCENILGKQPVEVFLFGCNTLNRSCEAQMSEERKQREVQRLMEVRGFNKEDAETLVEALSFSNVRSVKDEMRDVFEGTPAIHGFDGIAPIGRQIAPYLNDALKEIVKNSDGNYMNHLEKEFMNNSMGGDSDYMNEIFFKHLHTEFKEDFGHSNYSFCTGRDNVISEEDERIAEIKKNLCRLLNDKISNLEKLNFINSLIQQDKFFHYLPFISKLFKQLRFLKGEELEVYNQIKGNKDLKNKTLEFIESMNFGNVLLNALDLGETLGWIDSDTANKKRKETIVGALELEKITTQDKDLICGMAKAGSFGKLEDLKIEINEERLKHLDYEEGVEVFRCLKLKGEGVVTRLKSNIKNKRDLPIIKTSFNYVLALEAAKEDFRELLHHLISLDKNDVTSFVLEKLNNVGSIEDKKASEDFIAPLLDNKKHFWDVVKILSQFSPLKESTKKYFENNLYNNFKKSLNGHTVGDIIDFTELVNFDYDYFQNIELSSKLKNLIQNKKTYIHDEFFLEFFFAVGANLEDSEKKLPLSRNLDEYWRFLAKDNSKVTIENKIKILDKITQQHHPVNNAIKNRLPAIARLRSQNAVILVDHLYTQIEEDSKLKPLPLNDGQDLVLNFTDDQSLNNRMMKRMMAKEKFDNNDGRDFSSMVNVMTEYPINIDLNAENMQRLVHLIYKHHGAMDGRSWDDPIRQEKTFNELTKIKDGYLNDNERPSNQKSILNKESLLDYVLFEHPIKMTYYSEAHDFTSYLLINFFDSNLNKDKILDFVKSIDLKNVEKRERGHTYTSILHIISRR
jgi:hypothetical protein